MQVQTIRRSARNATQINWQHGCCRTGLDCHSAPSVRCRGQKPKESDLGSAKGKADLRKSALMKSAVGIFCGAFVFANVSFGSAHAGEGERQNASSSFEACGPAGQWIDPATGKAVPPEAALLQAASGAIVLLGESHTSKEDHLWQTHTLAGLFAHNPDIIVGFEAFPRDTQSVLDRWTAGDLLEDAFLKEVRWNDVWGYDADYYLPLFNFARQNRLGMKAINVGRSLVSTVGREGWENVAEKDRQGIGTPAPASEAYRKALADVFSSKLSHGIGRVADEGSEAEKEEPKFEDILTRTDFNNFVDAQLVWDRAMAEALFDASEKNPGVLVVGILGRGHVENGFGVPHQLESLGAEKVVSLLPITVADDCRAIEASIADLVFLVDDRETEPNRPQRPRLGVFIEPASDGGVLLSRVTDGSIAEAADLRSGDVVLKAAGEDLSSTADLVEIIQRQAPGTWLPLEIERDGEIQTLVAKFPSASDTK